MLKTAGYRTSALYAFVSGGTSYSPRLVWRSRAGGFDASKAKLASGDVNGDGKADAIVLYDNGYGVSTLYAFVSSGSSFTQRTYWRSARGRFYAPKAKLASGDVNGDGKADAIVLYDNGYGVSTLYAFVSSGSSFTQRTFWRSARGRFYASRAKLASGDVNGDGKADAIALYDNGYGVSTLYAFVSSGSSFTQRTYWRSARGRFYASRAKLASGDVNGDGKADAIALYDNGYSTSTLYAFRSNESSSTQVRLWRSTRGRLAWRLSRPCAGDVNGDGKADAIVLYDNGSNTSSIYSFVSGGSSCRQVRSWVSARGGFAAAGTQIAASMSELIIPSTTEVLAPATTSALTSASPDLSTLVFSSENTQVARLDRGDVLVSGITTLAPDGMLRRVVSVSDDAGRVTVETTQASIGEAIQRGTVSHDRALTPATAVSMSSLSAGVSLATATVRAAGRVQPALVDAFTVTLSDVVLYDGDGNHSTTNDQVTADGSFQVRPTLHFGMHVDGAQIRQITFAVTLDESMPLLELDSKVTLAQFAPEPVQLARYDFAPMTIMAGPWPVVIAPRLKLMVGANGQVSAGVTASIIQNASLTGGLTYDNGSWRPIASFTNTFDFNPPTASAGARAQAWVGPRLDVMIYGVAGPTMTAKGYLELDVDPLSEPLWTLSAGLEVEAGVAVDIDVVFAHVAVGYSATVIDYRRVLAQAPDVRPPAPVMNLAARAGDRQIALTWTNPTSDFAATRVLRSTTAYATTSTVGSGQTRVYEGSAGSYTDTGLTNGTTCYYTAFARDAAGNWSAARNVSATPRPPTDTIAPAPVANLTATPGDSQVALTWTNPTDSDFAATRVLRSTTAYATTSTAGSGQTQVYEGSAASYTDTGLNNGTTCYYTAFARDAAGNWSAARNVSATPRPPTDSIAPAPVTNLTATPGDSQVALTWTNPTSDFAATRILRSTTGYATTSTPGGTQTQIYDSGGTSYTDTGRTNGTTCYYTAFARDAAGNWSATRTVSATPQGSGEGNGASYVLVTEWGSFGTGDGQFSSPSDVDVDSSGNVYVSDGSGVQKFTSSGAFVTKWVIPAHGIAVDSSGYLYATDGSAHVRKYDSSGAFVTSWGGWGYGAGQFRQPTGIAVDSAGNVYVTELLNDRVQKFTSSGAFVTSWGYFDNILSDGVFFNPSDVDVDSSGNVYVADTGNHRVQKFTSSGTFVTSWRGEGTAEGPLSNPWGIAVDSSGNVYVTDEGRCAVRKTTSSGTFVTEWGSYGTGYGQFVDPWGIAVDSSGSVYVTDISCHRIQKFAPASSGPPTPVDSTAPGRVSNLIATPGDSRVGLSWTNPTDPDLAAVRVVRKTGSFPVDRDDGTTAYEGLGTSFTDTGRTNGTTYYYAVFARDASDNWSAARTVSATPQGSGPSGGGYAFVTRWGSEGYGDGQFYYPQGVAVDSSGNVYVADSNNHRIQKFTSSGTFVTSWGGEGSGDGQFSYPADVAVDSSGNVFVADTNNDRIQKFTSSGTFVTKWGTSGSGDGQFIYPYGVAVDSSGNVFVADTNNDRIQKFTSSGTFVTKWGTSGSGDGQFNRPAGVTVDSSGNVYVADTENHRIQKFTSSGAFVTKWGSEGSGDGQFHHPQGVAVDSSGNVFVADTVNNRVQKFTSSGTFVTKWGSFGSGDGQFYYPYAVVVDSSGNVYVLDTNHFRIQKFTPASP